MSDASKKKIDDFDELNASALAQMLVDPTTSEAVRIQIINELNEAAKSDTFFEAMYNDALSLGACPHCHHKSHWLIPEDDLNQMGWVSSKTDPRVNRHTNSNVCPEFAEACAKKKTTV